MTVEPSRVHSAVIGCLSSTLASLLVFLSPFRETVPTNNGVLAVVWSFVVSTAHFGTQVKQCGTSLVAAALGVTLGTGVRLLTTLGQDQSQSPDVSSLNLAQTSSSEDYNSKSRLLAVLILLPVSFLGVLSDSRSCTPLSKVMRYDLFLISTYLIAVFDLSSPSPSSIFDSAWYVMVALSVGSLTPLLVGPVYLYIVSIALPAEVPLVLSRSPSLLEALDDFNVAVSSWYEGLVQYSTTGTKHSADLDSRRRKVEAKFVAFRKLILDLQAEPWTVVPESPLHDLDTHMSLMVSLLLSLRQTFDGGYESIAYERLWKPLWLDITRLQLKTLEVLRGNDNSSVLERCGGVVEASFLELLVDDEEKDGRPRETGAWPDMEEVEETDPFLKNLPRQSRYSRMAKVRREFQVHVVGSRSPSEVKGENVEEGQAKSSNEESSAPILLSGLGLGRGRSTQCPSFADVFGECETVHLGEILRFLSVGQAWSLRNLAQRTYERFVEHSTVETWRVWNAMQRRQAEEEGQLRGESDPGQSETPGGYKNMDFLSYMVSGRDVSRFHFTAITLIRFALISASYHTLVVEELLPLMTRWKGRPLLKSDEPLSPVLPSSREGDKSSDLNLDENQQFGDRESSQGSFEGLPSVPPHRVTLEPLPRKSPKCCSGVRDWQPHLEMSIWHLFRNFGSTFAAVFSKAEYFSPTGRKTDDLNELSGAHAFFWRFLAFPLRLSLAASITSCVVVLWAEKSHYVSEFGFWAFLPVAFCSLHTVGGALVKGFRRILGTLLGGSLALLTMTIFPGNGPAYFLCNIMLTFLGKILASHPMVDYAGLVFAFTWQVVALGNWEVEDRSELLTIGLYRMAMTMVGVLMAVLLSCILFPVYSITMLRQKTAEVLLASAEFVGRATKKVLEHRVDEAAADSHGLSEALVFILRENRDERTYHLEPAAAEVRLFSVFSCGYRKKTEEVKQERSKDEVLLKVQGDLMLLLRCGMVAHAAASLAFMGDSIYETRFALHPRGSLVPAFRSLLWTLKHEAHSLALNLLNDRVTEMLARLDSAPDAMTRSRHGPGSSQRFGSDFEGLNEGSATQAGASHTWHHQGTGRWDSRGGGQALTLAGLEHLGEEESFSCFSDLEQSESSELLKNLSVCRSAFLASRVALIKRKLMPQMIRSGYLHVFALLFALTDYCSGWARLQSQLTAGVVLPLRTVRRRAASVPSLGLAQGWREEEQAGKV